MRDPLPDLVPDPLTSRSDALADVACVVIGRNEAPRLLRCLGSVLRDCSQVLYVDSGSTDTSVAIARAAGVPVLELDPARPFSAARARNEGLARLLQADGAAPALVQFVDGDCWLEPGWLHAAAAAMRRNPRLAVVSGRSREATPKRSPYNLLCDIELDVPAAATGACGGVAMMRAAAFDAVGGFDTALAAGEEPELCLRLRRRGWLIDSLVAPMMQHELGIDRFAAWWRRSARGGRAYFESWWKHRGGPEAFRRREVARIVLWGGVVPALIVAAVVAFGAVASCAPTAGRGAAGTAARRACSMPPPASSASSRSSRVRCDRGGGSRGDRVNTRGARACAAARCRRRAGRSRCSRSTA
jgi:GT2 family glycosyltransferase